MVPMYCRRVWPNWFPMAPNSVSESIATKPAALTSSSTFSVKPT
jgi:hypothetical protein